MTQAIHNIVLEEKMEQTLFNENHRNPPVITVTQPDSPSSPTVEQPLVKTNTEASTLEQTSQPLSTSGSNPQPLKFPKKDCEMSIMSTGTMAEYQGVRYSREINR